MKSFYLFGLTFHKILYYERVGAVGSLTKKNKIWLKYFKTINIFKFN